MAETSDQARWSLRQRLTRMLVLAALLPSLLFGGALLWSQWHDEHDAMVLRLDANARVTANAIDDFLEGERAGVALLAARGDGGDTAAQLALLLRVYPAMLRAFRLDADGQVVAALDARGRPVPRASVRFDDEDWFRAARDTGQPQISGVIRSRIHHSEILSVVAAPLHDREGRFSGALAAAIPVGSFARLNSDNLSRRNLELLVLDEANRVVFSGPGLRWQSLGDAGAAGRQLRRGALPAAQSTRVRAMSGLLSGGGEAYANAVAMRNGWIVALVTPKQRMLAPFLPRMWLLAGLLLATSLGLGIALWRQRVLLQANIGFVLASLRGYALGGRMDPARMARMPEELQPLADGIGELGARMNAAYDELRQVLDQRDHVIAERTGELSQAVSELNLLSRTDALTGSLNYRGFVEAGERLFREAREGDAALSVLALDIDHFKRYNDMYGHAEGDGALRRFAGAVRSALLHADDVLARPGGEEFTVFLPGSSHEQAMGVAERVCQRVRDADIAHAGSPKGRMTVSVGVASLAPGDSEVEDVLRRADEALYRAKAAGRDCAST